MSTYTRYAQRLPAVATDVDGDFVVAWVDQRSDYDLVLARRFGSDGAPRGTELQVNSESTARYVSVEVASDADGGFVVAWAELCCDYTAFSFKARRFDSSGEPRPEIGPTLSGGSPDVSSDAEGDFVIVWQEFDTFYSGIVGQRYDSAGSAVGTELAIDGQVAELRRADPSVSSEPDGDFVVAWRGSPGFASSYIFGRRFDSGGQPRADAFRVSAFTGGYASEPRVAADAEGDFVIVWQEHLPDQSRPVLARGFDAAGEDVFTTTVTNQGTQPDVASDRDGDSLVVWQRAVIEEYDVAGRRLDTSGAPVGSEFLVNTYTALNQSIPRVAAHPAGSFVVVWESEAQDGDGRGAFGQLLGAAP